MDEYVEQFFHEEREALAEVCRLTAVFKDALWYNMELYDKRYNPSRVVALQGSRTAKCGNAEHTHFPVYYAGPLRDAPELPLAIIMNELRDGVHTAICEYAFSKTTPCAASRSRCGVFAASVWPYAPIDVRRSSATQSTVFRSSTPKR